jgi:hypothetical protein
MRLARFARGAGGIVRRILKRAPHAFFSATGMFLAVYLIAGSTSFTRLISLPVQDRYFEVLVPFLGVAAASLVHVHGQFRSRERNNAIGVGLALVVALTSWPAIVANPGDIYADIEVIADTGPLRPGFYILHPWRDTAAQYPRAADIAPLPTYVVVDEDHRILGRLAAKVPNREIAVKHVEGG